MTTTADRFQQTLEDVVENELSAQSETLARAIVATLSNACDDERGRLDDENRRLRAEITELRIQLDTANRQLADLDERCATAEHSTDRDYDEAAVPR